MKKFFTLLALMLLCSVGAWAENNLVASTTEANPEHQYRLRPRNNANYWITKELYSGNKEKAGWFAFFKADGENNYYVYSVDEDKWLTYSNTSNGAEKITLSETKSSYFNITYGTSTANNADGDKTGYLLRAYNNGSLVGAYMNFFNGPQDYASKTIGFYSGNWGDAGSVWVFDDNIDVTYILDNAYGERVSDVQSAKLGTWANCNIEFYTVDQYTEQDCKVSKTNNTFHVSGTWNLPFEEGKTYTMKSHNSTYNFVYNGFNAYCNNSTAASMDNDLWSFEHVANTLNLFKVKNGKGGYATISSANNQTLVTFQNTATAWTSGTNATSYFRIAKNTTNASGFDLQHPGNKQANVGNHVSGGLGVWNPGNNNAINNDGSCLLVTEADHTVDAYRTDATNLVDTWYLASETVKNNAKTAISNASDKAGVLTAVTNGYTAYNTEISAKYYQIKNAAPNFQTKQGVDKAFVAGDSKVTWGTLDSENPYQYFQISVNNAGFYNIKSYKVNKYMTETVGTLGSSASNNTTLKDLGGGQYNIAVAFTNPCHTEGHNQGAGVSGNIVAYNGGKDGFSAWYFVETTQEAYNTANTKTISYTVTDANGTSYTGSFVGGKGDLPPFNGVTGQTYTSAVWSGEGQNLTLTANIAFPFPVSTATVHNYTYIGIQANSQKLLYNDNGNVKMSSGVLPNNGNADNYKWEIIPSFSDGVFTFTIKNFSGKYIAGTSTTAPASAFALRNEGTGYAFGNTNISNGRGFYVPNTNYFLSINSPGNSDQNLFIWDKSGTSHTGSNLGFFTPDDFESLMSALSLIGEGVGKYTATEEGAATAAAILAGTQTKTAAELRTLIGTFTLNLPETGKFYRLKGQTGRYMCSDVAYAGPNDQNVYTMKDKAGNENKTIFYLTNDKHLVAYATGMSVAWGWMAAMNGADHECTWTISAAEDAVAKYIFECPNTSTWASLRYLGDVTGQAHLNRQAAINADAAWTIEAVDELPVTLPTSGITTFYAPVDMQVNGDVNVYVGSIDEEETTITYTKLADKKIPAGTGVLIKGTPSASITISPIDEEVTAQSSIILGKEYTTACTQDGETFIYTLSSGVFQYYTGSTLAGFKGHLELKKNHQGSNSPLRVVFEDEFLTGIEAIAAEANQNIFDLQGRRVNNAQKGLYIINGRKVVR